MHDIMRILGFEEEEQLVDWPLLIKMPLEILDKAAANVVQLVIKLIMRVSGCEATQAEERSTLRRVVGELVIATSGSPTILESDQLVKHLTDLGKSENTTTRRYMQSVICKSLSYRRAREVLATTRAPVELPPAVGEHAFTSRRADFEVLAGGGNLEPALKYVRLKRIDIVNALEFVQNNCDLSWRNGHIVSRSIGAEKVELPRLRRHLSMEFLFGGYVRWAKSSGLGSVGRHEFYSLLRLVTVEVQNVTGASYYFTDGVIDSFKMLRELLARLSELVPPATSHSQCDHEHEWSCGSCSALDRLCDEIGDLVNQLRQRETEEDAQLVSMTACLQRVGGQIFRYVKHAARGVWQHARIADTMIESVNNPVTKTSVIFVDLDHKQKILGRKLVENQMEYFGKAGMSLLGAMVMSAPRHDGTDEARDGNAESVGVLLHFVDMVVANGAQDVFQVISCLEALILVLHDRFPEANRMVLISDNASVFTSGEWIPWVIKLTRKYPHLRVSRYKNTEAQTGRDMLDAHFSFLNRKMDSFVRKDNAIQTPDDLYSALTDEGGVANTTALLLGVDSLKASLFNNAKSSFSSKIKSGVRRIHDTVYEPACDSVCIGTTPMCRIFTKSEVPNSVITNLLAQMQRRTRLPRYVCAHTHAEQIVASVLEKTLSAQPHCTPAHNTEGTTLTGVIIKKRFSSSKSDGLRKALTVVLASESATGVVRAEEASSATLFELVRCPQCSKRYSCDVALNQHETICSEYVFRDKNELIVSALKDFFTVSKQTFVDTRSCSISSGGVALEASTRRSRRNWAEKESVNEFAILPLRLKEAIKSFFTEQREHDRKVKPHDVIEFLKASIVATTDWDSKFLLTEQRLKTELSRLAK
ncbi:hypothetical protein PF001_g24910 [Phytophthora fragariae]|uniref:Uncharacterized protein n=1 Tax=Phytophthora fragariae TaxID=53985 RepID=A0A6A4BV32_9STRA|nr:hypothetical protein PF001_g24910 [Phytophthora fragariae]